MGADEDLARDVLVDCMTSFGVHGDTAYEIAVHMLSRESGLLIGVDDGLQERIALAIEGMEPLSKDDPLMVDKVDAATVARRTP